MTAELFDLRISYQDWNSVPRGGGRALCLCPSVSAVNSKLSSPLKWDSSKRAFTGSCEQMMALAEALYRVGNKYAKDGDASITARLTVKQAKHLLKMSWRVRESLAQKEL